MVEEPPGPGFAAIAPQLAEGFLEQVGGIETLVRGQQGLERLATFQGEVLAVGQQRVLLTLDEAAIVADQPGVLGLAHLVERLAEVAQDMKLVEQDGRLRRMRGRRIAERPPHVHQRQPDPAALGLAQPTVELIHAGLRAVLAAEPDRPAAIQIADHDAIGVPLPNRDFVDANPPRSGRTRLGQLCPQVLFLQRLDAVPVQVQLVGHVLDRGAAAAPAHVVGEALGIERAVRQKLQPLDLHRPAVSAENPPRLEFQINPVRSAGQIAHPPRPAVVPPRVHAPTHAAGRFFERRGSRMTRASGSPKMPWISSSGRNPGNRYASTRRRLRLVEVGIHVS